MKSEITKELCDKLCESLRSGSGTGCPRPDHDKAKCPHKAAGGWCYKVATLAESNQNKK